jgi:hypothetical protein
MKIARPVVVSALLLLLIFNCTMTINRKVRIIVPDSKRKEVYRGVMEVLKSILRGDSEFTKQALEKSGLNYEQLTKTLTIRPTISNFVMISDTKESGTSIDCVISVSLGGNDLKIEELSQFAAEYIYGILKEKFPEYEVETTF